jgi:polyhydroxyalkanoate synthesis regulator phasin
MSLWEKIKNDLQKGIEESMAVIKEGSAAIKEKAGELTEEGKRRYKLFELKKEAHEYLAEFGGKIYDLASKVENPMLDTEVKAIMEKIKHLEEQIAKLEGKQEIN